MAKGLIVLDPGHGRLGNQYPDMPGTYEGTQMFLFAGYLRDQLIARDFDVLVTRSTLDDDPSLAERGEMAGKNGAVLFLSLHSNAPGAMEDKEAYRAINGTTTFYSLTDPDGNIPLARALNDAVAAAMNNHNRGIHTREYPDRPGVDYYGVIRASAQSGCSRAILVEHGFHTNPADSAFLTNAEKMQNLAKLEAEIIDEYLK